MTFPAMKPQGLSKERRRVLETRDQVAFSMSTGCSPDTALIAIHKASLECRELDDLTRLDSLAWLRAGGYGRMGGMPLPPVGVLP